jgi:hypothetical protein
MEEITKPLPLERVFKMKHMKLLLPLILMVLIFAACAPQVVPAPPAQETPVVSEPLPPTGDLPAGVEAARQALADRLGIAVEEVNVLSYEQVDWPDGCLGLGGPAEACLAAITPGYAVRLEAGGEAYAYRTNLEGTAVREDFFVASANAVDLARYALAERLGVSVDQVIVVGQAPVEWPDACLGLPAEDELCAMVITPGYEITLQVGEELFVFHTNGDGSNIREAPGGIPASEAVRDILAQRTGSSLAQIEPVSEERVEWNDACLGVYQPDIMCAEVITPGYRLVYLLEGEEFVLHTNLDLSAIVLASAPLPEADSAVMVWEERDNGCSTLIAGKNAAAYGPCGAELMPALYASGARAEELRYLVMNFRSFEAETDAGMVVFRGEGAREPSEIEQRAVAEWARQAFIEAREGSRDPAVNEVLHWQREGGIAGFCDTLRVSKGGFALAESCKSDVPIGMVFLSPEQLDQMFEWHENLVAFEVEESDDAAADGMTIRLIFNGNGSQPASEQDQEAMLNLANDLFNQITIAQ